MNIIEAKKILKNKIIGITCHNSIKLAKKSLINGADYIAVGAFYKTETKKVKFRAKLSILKKKKKLTNNPIVAIGGINERNYKKLLLNKANFLAISSYIWNNNKYKPYEAIKKIKMKINATEIRVGMILEHKDDLWEVLKNTTCKTW